MVLQDHKKLIWHLRNPDYFLYGKCQPRVEVRFFNVYDKNIPEHNHIFHNLKRKKTKLHLESIFDRLPLHKLMATSEVQESWNKWKIGSKY